MYFEYYYVATQPQEDPTTPSNSEYTVSNIQRWLIQDLINILTKTSTDFDLSKSGITVKYFTGYTPQWDIVSYNPGDYSGTIVSKSTDNQFKKTITISTVPLANSFATANASGAVTYQAADITLTLNAKDYWNNTTSDITFKFFPSGGSIFVSTNNTHLAMAGLSDAGVAAVPFIISDFDIFDDNQQSNYAKFIGVSSASMSKIWDTTGNVVAAYPGTLYPTGGTYSADPAFKCTISSNIKAAITPYILSGGSVYKSNYVNHIYINKTSDTADYHIGGNVSSKCAIYAMPLVTTTAATTGIAFESIVINNETYVVWPLVYPVVSNTKKLLVRKN